MQTERQREGKKKGKREKREKHKSATVMHQETINNAYQQFQILTKKQYCNLLLKEEEKIGINKLHIFTIIIHHTLVQHTWEYYIVVTVLIETNMIKQFKSALYETDQVHIYDTI